MTIAADDPGRSIRWVLYAGAVYIMYLLLLGPFWALAERGYIPDSLHRVAWAPSIFCRELPFAGQILGDYLDWWYVEPQAGETTH